MRVVKRANIGGIPGTFYKTTGHLIYCPRNSRNSRGPRVADCWGVFMSCRFRILKQFLNRCQQYCTLCLRLWSEVKDECLKWAFRILYVCLQGIVFCGPLEAAPAIPNNIGLERKNCSQVSVMVLVNDDGCSLSAGGKPKQCVIERSAKFGASNDITSMSIAPAYKQPPDANASNSQKPDVRVADMESENIHPSIWVFVVMVLLSILSKPNRELSCACF